MASADTDRLLRELLAHAAATAPTRQERQLVALVAAYLDGDHDRVRALAREHLLDHPDDVRACWIASLSASAQDQSPTQHHHHKEKP